MDKRTRFAYLRLQARLTPASPEHPMRNTVSPICSTISRLSGCINNLARTERHLHRLGLRSASDLPNYDSSPTRDGENGIDALRHAREVLMTIQRRANENMEAEVRRKAAREQRGRRGGAKVTQLPLREAPEPEVHVMDASIIFQMLERLEQRLDALQPQAPTKPAEKTPLADPSRPAAVPTAAMPRVAREPL